MIKTIFNKYKDLVYYMIFGLLTTVVNVILYYLCSHILNLPTTISTFIAWFMAVSFAYLTNRTLVFHSNAKDFKMIVREIVSFFLCRVATGLLDIGIMYLFVDILKQNDIIIKIASNILVIVLNFIASKLIIFRRDRNEKV